LIAEITATEAKRKAAGDVSNDLSVNWLPFVDAYRTMCLVPAPELKRLLEDVRDLRLVGAVPTSTST
jgi:hypothetical protein